MDCSNVDEVLRPKTRGHRRRGIKDLADSPGLVLSTLAILVRTIWALARTPLPCRRGGRGGARRGEGRRVVFSPPRPFLAVRAVLAFPALWLNTLELVLVLVVWSSGLLESYYLVSVRFCPVCSRPPACTVRSLVRPHITYNITQCLSPLPLSLPHPIQWG